MRFRSPLIIVYTGDFVRVDAKLITKNMRVPNLGFDPSRHADRTPSAVAARLFQSAVSQRALVIPDCLLVFAYARDTFDRHEFMLLACAATGTRAGVTHGWCAVELLAREVEDSRTDDDPAVVREALEIMAAKINAALKGE